MKAGCCPKRRVSVEDQGDREACRVQSEALRFAQESPEGQAQPNDSRCS